MPSFDIHAKYCRRFGISDEVCEIINKYIDGANPERKHDVWRNFIEVEERLREREVDGGTIVRHYKFKGREFMESKHYEFVRSFSNGLEAFLLHATLDILRNVRGLGLRNFDQLFMRH